MNVSLSLRQSEAADVKAWFGSLLQEFEFFCLQHDFTTTLWSIHSLVYITTMA